MRQVIFILFLVLFSFSCRDEKEQIRLAVDTEVQILIDQFRAQKKEECERLMLIEAERLSDSIMNTYIINPLSDSVYNPVLPPKPSFVPVDTSVMIDKSEVSPIQSDQGQNEN